MEKKKKNGIKNFLSGKGFLIATLMGIAAVGVSTFVAYDRAISKISINTPSGGVVTEAITFPAPKSEAGPVNKNEPNITKPPVTTSSEKEVIAPIVPNPEIPANVDGNNIDQQANNPISKDPKRVMPTDGEIINAFSNGELVKSKTLGVWKTHDGIDIAAEIGSPVVSIFNGTVTAVKEEPLWGTTVLVDYGDGISGHYYGLEKNTAVSAGAEIKTGDPIGSVGNTAEVEISDPPHLHFALSQNGEWIDPLKYING